MRTSPVLSALVVMLAVSGSGLRAQKLGPQDLAARLSGTWVLNRELSTGFRAPGRRGGAEFEPVRMLSLAAPTQRGRGGGGRDATPMGPGDLTPEQRAEQAAMRQLQQIAERVVIKATPESVTFTDSHGERTFAVDNRASKIDVAGSPVNVKSKWDKNVLRQEFSNTQAKLVETWGLDGAGHLVLTAKVESMTLITPDEKAVFDRQ